VISTGRGAEQWPSPLANTSHDPTHDEDGGNLSFTHGGNPRTSSAIKLVATFVSSDTDESAETVLEELLQNHAVPLIMSVVRSKLPEEARGWNQAETGCHDICHEVLLQLVQRLRDIRRNPAQPAINDFSSYVATCSYNACHQYLREKYPGRTKFKNRLRYLLHHKPQFAVWQSGTGELLCGLAVWPSPKELSPFVTDESIVLTQFDPEESLTPECRPEQLERLIEKYLDSYGRPMYVDRLAGALAEVCQVCEPRVVRTHGDTETSLVEILPSYELDVVSQIELRTELQQLWGEITQLPRNQRYALLLNMRDDRGSDALILFCRTGVTTLHGIAALLGMDIRTFASLWNRLPLEDNAIAERLGLNRQQVINLRKSARQRLARRMAAGG
jgi:hypothetical protein